MFQHTLASLSNRPPVTLTCSTLGLRSIADPNIFFTFQGAKLGAIVGEHIDIRDEAFGVCVYVLCVQFRGGEFPDMGFSKEGKERERNWIQLN